MMYRRTCVLFTLFVASILTSPALALDPSRQVTEYPVDFWQESSGLPQNKVNAILQTRDGYLWVGTNGGVGRFDGVRFTEYSRRTGHLRVDAILALAEAPDGSIWIGASGGGASVLDRTGTVTTWVAKDGLPHDQVQALAVGADGTAWIGTPSGLARIDKDRKISVVDSKLGLPYGDRPSANANVRSLVFDRKGVLWIGCTQGLASYSGGQFTNYAVRQPGVLDRWIERIAPDPARDGLWLVSRDPLGTTTATNTTLLWMEGGAARRHDSDVGLPDKLIDVAFDGQGTFWVATQTGLHRRREGRFESYFSSISQVGTEGWVQTVSLRNTIAVYGDREGNLWAGTSDDGLARLRDSIVTTVSAGRIDGVEQAVSAVREGRPGTLWFSLDGHKVVRLQDGVQTIFQGPDTYLIYTVLEDSRGTLWAGDRNGLLRSQGQKLVPYPVEGVSKVSAILEDPSGALWVGTRFGGIFRVREGEPVRRWTQANGLPTSEITSLARDASGALWAGTRGGVAVLRGDRIQAFTPEQGLPNRYVNDVHVDARGVVWTSTREGLARIEGERVFAYKRECGLPTEAFLQIAEDDLGYLWLTHSRGVLRVATADLDAVAAGRASSLTYRAFGAETGMKSTAMPDQTAPTAWKASDGRLWLATGRGVAVFDPRALTSNALPPPVNIEEIRVDAQPSLPRDAMAFAPGAGDVEIRYTGLSFVDPKGVRFKYRLDGVDADWVDAGTRRVAYYTKLAPGAYRFRVKAANNDGVWNEDGDTLRFTLRPHWYQRRSVHAGMLVLLALGLAAAHRARVREHKSRALELARKVEEALGQIKILRGMVPVCASCKKIRDDQGYWNQMETYIAQHSEADLHGICPDCVVRLYPEYAAAATAGDRGGPAAPREPKRDVKPPST